MQKTRMIETTAAALVTAGNASTYYPHSTATPAPGHTNVLDDIARTGGMNGVFPANPTVDDFWRWLICEVANRVGSVADKLDMQLARDFIEAFGYGHIKCPQRFWDIVAPELTYQETKSTQVWPRLSVSEMASAYLEALAMQNTGDGEEQAYICREKEEDVRLIVDFCESYDEMKHVWYMVLYHNMPKFLLSYAIGHPDVRQSLLQKGEEIGMENYVKAHFEAGVPLEDLFCGGERDPNDVIYAAGSRRA